MEIITVLPLLGYSEVWNRWIDLDKEKRSMKINHKLLLAPFCVTVYLLEPTWQHADTHTHTHQTTTTTKVYSTVFSLIILNFIIGYNTNSHICIYRFRYLQTMYIKVHEWMEYNEYQKCWKICEAHCGNKSEYYPMQACAMYALFL